MKNPVNTAHPLKNRAATSQSSRRITALEPEFAAIDGKTLADRLYLIHAYARQINYYEYTKDENGVEYQDIGNWLPFFNDSLPFQLAVLSKTAVSDLEKQFQVLYKELLAHPSRQSLESLLGFVYDKLLVPTSALYKTVWMAENSFSTPLLAIIKSTFIESVKCYIALYNASVTFLCVCKRGFSDYLEPPWQLTVDEIYSLDPCIIKAKKGKKEAILMAAASLSALFYKMLNGFGQILETAPDYIAESIIPLKAALQKKHEPHLALLFTFLELFKHFQGNINGLGKKHLDFFYKNVLRVNPKAAVPDKAHIIFEMAKHLDNYLLKKDLKLKDSKDNNNQDILFGLDQELVLDKAQVKELRSLSLNYMGDVDHMFLEGVYMAPVASSVDGKGKAFKEGAANNWTTLGSKYSKQILEGNEMGVPHPKARIGFVLASPVLLLEEGKRTITINLHCVLPPGNMFTAQVIKNMLETSLQQAYYLNEEILNDCAIGFSIGAKAFLSALLINGIPYAIGDLKQFLLMSDPDTCKPIFTQDEREALCECLQSKMPLSIKLLFKIAFSGEKDWIVPKPLNIKEVSIAAPFNNKLNFKIQVELDGDVPKIVFFDAEKLMENLPLKKPFPLVKIELNPDVKIREKAIDCHGLKQPPRIVEDVCCLKKGKKPLDEIDISPYYYLRGLMLDNAHIDVTVCGVKNLIVQNDENLQDVNKPIMPFGPRPIVNSSFLIGSKEIYCKNWESFRLNIEWKDRPADFNKYYEAYNQSPPPTITDNSFDIEASVLEDANWKINGSKKLFLSKEFFPPCPAVNLAPNYNGYKWNRADFAGSAYEKKSMPIDPLLPLNITSRKAFFRIQLKGEDFQHDRYAYVLASQMMKLTKLLTPAEIELLKEKAAQAKILSDDTGAKIIGLKGLANKAAIVNAIEKMPLIPPLPPFQLTDTQVPNSLSPYGLENVDVNLNKRVTAMDITLNKSVEAIPNEPFTPVIKGLSIDYKAVAEKDDIDIIHLYPFEKTSKLEDIEQQPTLFPYFNDEGTLFIGFENCSPGGNLSLLFQLAEATADSESDRAKIAWHYLGGNQWKKLLQDFDIIADGTDGFTSSGIVTIAVPDGITNKGNTIMPDGLYWIKAAAAKNVTAVAETIGVHTQAARASALLGELNDTNRLEKALEPGSVSKLAEGDFNVKKVEQPYPSYEGRRPEVLGHFYTRVSEHLKHKGRGITIQDYEKIVLEGFPEIYKAKCISHTMGLSARNYRRDLEVAPGFIVLAVIPDLTKLKTGSNREPKAPLSLLEKIGDHLRKRIGPFARLKVLNPRYEYVDVIISIRLYRGKSDSYYAKKLHEDISNYLAPWYLGDSEKLSFGQEVWYSDIVGFVERLDYVDYIVNLELKGECDQINTAVIKPLTARSVLTGGKICVEIDKEVCQEAKQAVEVLKENDHG